MNIGIIGSGNIGGTLAPLLTRAGHQVVISNSRGPASLVSEVQELGSGVRAATVEDAANFGEIVVLAIPFKAYPGLPTTALRGKIVIDATNYYPQRDGEINVEDYSSSELIARQLPGSKVVKAFNTLYFKVLANDGNPAALPENRLAIFLAGDDEAAKKVVANLIDEIGFTAVDTGNLQEGSRRQEPGTQVYGQSLYIAQAREILEH